MSFGAIPLFGGPRISTGNFETSYSTVTVGSRSVDAASVNCNEKKEESTQTENALYVTKFMEGLKGLLQSGQYSDIILNVRDKEFKVHKTVLAAHSPVFAAMMEHNTREKATGIVNIEDGDPDIFTDFLQFLYSGSTENLNSENIIDLYIVADKYQVCELNKACRLYVIQHISLETFCDVMVLSLRYHDKELLDVATRYFLHNSLAIVKTAKWLTFLRENLVAGNELIVKAFELLGK